MKKKINTISGTANSILNVILAVYAASCILPLIIVLSISFSSEADLLEKGYGLLPRGFSTYAYNFLLNDFKTILNAYGITVFATVTGTVVTTFNVALFAYPISRQDFRYRKFFTYFMVFTMLFNGGLVPWYVVCVQFLDLKNRLIALVLPYTFNAFWVIVMRTFYKTTIPASLLESAKLDGAGEGRVFFRIVMPLSLPGLATVALFTSLLYWNDWWLPLVLVNDEKMQNLQYMIYRVLNNLTFLKAMADRMPMEVRKTIDSLPSESARMAMCIITIGPIVFAYPLFQKYFIKGLTIGAIKG